MEFSQDSLLEELMAAPSTWSFTPSDQTSPFVTSYSLLELISPLDQFSNPYGDDAFEPFLDAALSASPENEMFGSFCEKGDSLLENCINSGVDDSLRSEVTASAPVIIDGEKKRKARNQKGQPSKNLMAERRRRKRLNDRLSMLRSIVPKISKMDRTSILGDTIDYMKELLHKIEKVREEVLDHTTLITHHDGSQITNPPKFDVERRSQDTKVEMCSAPLPGLLLSTQTTLDAFGLDIHQCVVSKSSLFRLLFASFLFRGCQSPSSCEPG